MNGSRCIALHCENPVDPTQEKEVCAQHAAGDKLMKDVEQAVREFMKNIPLQESEFITEAGDCLMRGMGLLISETFSETIGWPINPIRPDFWTQRWNIDFAFDIGDVQDEEDS